MHCKGRSNRAHAQSHPCHRLPPHPCITVHHPHHSPISQNSLFLFFRPAPMPIPQLTRVHIKHSGHRPCRMAHHHSIPQDPMHAGHVATPIIGSVIVHLERLKNSHSTHQHRQHRSLHRDAHRTQHHSTHRQALLLAHLDTTIATTTNQTLVGHVEPSVTASMSVQHSRQPNGHRRHRQHRHKYDQ
jgi:hypothetical protein